MSLFNKFATLMLLTLCFHGYAQTNTAKNQSIPQEGKEYSTLANPIHSQPKVIEFFSFYCNPCYQFVENYPVADGINKILPNGETVIKYHVSVMGPLGNELTEAWAIATVMGKTDDIEKPLFEAVHNKKITSVSDIKDVFSERGIDAAVYENARQSIMVKEFIARQNSAMEKYSVRGTPTFYVKGTYQINNGGITASTPEGYVDGFTQTVQALLER
ncbi:DsbA family protein [Rahnella sp. FC061912-K]|uniref:DsbA family protein n=1 Tax=Rahnella rivi TaxID=2816249 RepID=UPI001C276AC9|nr:DsbA family protein [Rahnella rivi]MBU9828517.1 DsbA family protein [Rahnella rivi]